MLDNLRAAGTAQKQITIVKTSLTVGAVNIVFFRVRPRITSNKLKDCNLTKVKLTAACMLANFICVLKIYLPMTTPDMYIYSQNEYNP